LEAPAALHDIIRKDEAMRLYFTSLASRRRNNGVVSSDTQYNTLAAIRRFLQFLNRPITETALSELIAEVRENRRKDDFTIDNALLRFVSTPPVTTRSIEGARIKSIFKANRTPLQASFNTFFTHSTRKISVGILKAIYDSLPEEHKLVMDFQAYAGERIACLCTNIETSQIELVSDTYAIIHIQARQTKARNNHICVVPRRIAERITAVASVKHRTRPFPNYPTIWREITNVALDKFGVRLTSHYLRKRFHTIAGKTPMPVNSWDFLMGDKQSLGHNAGTYTLEDFSELINEYDTFLAPYLSIGEPKEPDTPKEPIRSSAKTDEIEDLRKENAELKAQLIENNRLMQRFIEKLG